MAGRQQPRWQWEKRIAGWRGSGLSMGAYCRQHGLSYWMFVRWRQRLAAKVTPTAPLTLIPVVTPRASGAAITIRLPDGTSIEVAPDFDAGVLSAVVRALQGSSSC